MENKDLQVKNGTQVGEVVHHEVHEEHHHEESFWTKYIFSQDHKMIAKQFLLTGMFMGLVGGILSLLFRVQLAWPDESFPILEALLGKWAPGGKLDPNYYMALVTMHGTILTFFVLTAGLSGTFSNLLIPLQIGARDMASPFLNMLSYWFFFLSSVLMLSSFLIETGPAAAGWTVYPPLSALPQAMPGSGLGMTVWILSMALFIIGSMMGSLNYVVTVLNLRTEGMTFGRLPLTIWAFLLTAILGLLTFPVLLSAAILLLFDRSFGTSFYLDQIYIAGEALSREGGSVLLYLHLFWFLGHPEVYIILLPALGITSEVVSTHSRKPIFGYKFMVGSLIAITVLSIIVWGHHMFVTGMNPLIGGYFLAATLVIAVPSAIKVFNYLTTLWRGNIQFTPAMLFAVGMLSFFISGGLTGLYLGNSTTDIHLHNTYFVVGHFHLVMGVASIFGMFSGVYHWFPKFFGRHLNKNLAYIHFWGTLLGAYFVFFPQYYMGFNGVPRRYYSFTAFDYTSEWADLNVVMTIFAFIGVLSQLIFFFNFFYSIFAGPRSTRNPWRSNTLEWTTPVNPGHGNWPGEIPKVYRWPYDYSKPGAPVDWIPQHISDEDLKNGVEYWKDAERYD